MICFCGGHFHMRQNGTAICVECFAMWVPSERSALPSIVSQKVHPLVGLFVLLIALSHKDKKE
jgi:hypothetical protein